ncbi:MAG: VOC family protein [Chloroflexi bacterium]|nr:VOC family protein [Chloroflexota bacterium]
MPRVVHFEIPIDNPDRAVKFYTKVFAWKIDKYAGPEDYWLVTTGPDNQPGINGALMRRQEPLATAVTNSIEVPSVDDYLKKVTAGGGKVVMPKMAIPGVGWAAYCSDTEGNKFGLFQSDTSAK